MRAKKLILYFIVFIVLSGCSTVQSDLNLESNNSQETIALSFEPATVKQTISKLDTNQIYEILKTKDTSDAKIIIFTKKENQQKADDYLYGGIKIDNKLYDLGQIGARQYLDGTSIQLIKSFPTEYIIRFDGAFGVNYSQTNYYIIKNQIPEPLLQVDGHVFESDLDGNGTIEIISSYGTPTETSIYVKENDKFMVTNVNKNIGATSVMFDHNLNVFSAFFKNEESYIEKQFKYADGHLQEIK